MHLKEMFCAAVSLQDGSRASFRKMTVTNKGDAAPTSEKQTGGKGLWNRRRFGWHAATPPSLSLKVSLSRLARDQDFVVYVSVRFANVILFTSHTALVCLARGRRFLHFPMLVVPL